MRFSSVKPCISLLSAKFPLTDHLTSCNRHVVASITAPMSTLAHSMNPTLSLVVSIDPTLHHYTPETLPDAGWDRIRSLHRSGSLDRHLTEDQDLDLRGMLWDMCCDPILTFSGCHPDDNAYRIFGDGSIHVITSADSEVWSSASEFVRERLLCDCDREDLAGTDARLADYAFCTVNTVTH